ncbi:acetyltransferase, GNAT family [Teladorsagia circumcincta]|uniref:N-terminal methionine N(alpha)-acetyltransferase NatC n=1 Tax=Teladorsagia circumcincta TaxID=45464 RepID=A0A2G9UZT3_TELCI|nr:acetyltransferase, GNAT family [Teladorsagia circumcincta]
MLITPGYSDTAILQLLIMSIGAAQNSQSSLDSTINTLKRCLQIAHGGGTPQPCPSANQDETQIGDIMRLITKDLSEPYSIYTYRYFIHNWPELCVLAYDTATDSYVGAVVCKLDRNAEGRRKGYLAMLAIDELYRKLGLGTRLVRRAIERMQAQGCDEVVLETEVSNVNAQRLYSNLGFIREKRLVRYYLNGVDAFRLKLYFSPPMAAAMKSSLV